MKSQINEYRYLYEIIKSERIPYAIGILGSCSITACLIIMQAFAWKNMFNAAVQNNINLLYKSIIIFFIPVMLLIIVSPFFVYLYSSSVKKAMFSIRKSIVGKLVRLPAKFYDRHHSGDIFSTLNNDVTLIETVYQNHLHSIFYQVILIIASLFSMFIINWKMAIPLFIIGIMFAVITSNFSRSLKLISNRIQRAKSKEAQRFFDIVNGMHVIRMFNLKNIIGGKYENSIKHLSNLGLMLGRKQAQLESITFLIGFLNHGGIYVLGAFLLINGSIELGVLTALVSLQINVSFAFLQIGSNYSQLHISISSVNRLNDIMTETDESLKPQYDNYLCWEKNSSGIKFENVGFNYIPDVPLLREINLTIERGKKVAFVGPSGSGKSTLAKIIMGFYPIQGGQVLIDGKPIQSISLNELRKLIAYVPQEVTLFQGTIEENIAMGNNSAEREEIISAAKAANAHSFITNLPNGYLTQIGELGRGLSGGEKQRIAIARAILKNAPYLILDEATSSLDAKSEDLVQEALKKLIQNRTTLTIAHKLNTIQSADIIYVMDKGRIVESGTHEELSNKESVYANLVRSESVSNTNDVRLRDS